MSGGIEQIPLETVPHTAPKNAHQIVKGASFILVASSISEDPIPPVMAPQSQSPANDEVIVPIAPAVLPTQESLIRYVL